MKIQKIVPKKEKNTEKLLSKREKIKQVTGQPWIVKRCALYLNHVACWKAV
jgi:hypothetical protein